MKILHVIANLASRSGGLAKAVTGMCGELARRGHEVTIFTTDFDFDNRLKVPIRTPVKGTDGVERWYFPVRPRIEYAISWQFARAVARNVTRFDVVHIHSMYRFTSLVAGYYCRRFKVPYIVQPHGGLDPVIFEHHGLRKRLYERLFEKRNLEGAAAIDFTARDEMLLAESCGMKLRGVVTPLGVNPDEPAQDCPKDAFERYWPELRGKRVLLYLGRLNFKKGLDLLAKAYGAVARRRDDVHLLIAGPDEQGYQAKVQSWMDEEGVGDRVSYAGMVQGEKKAAAWKGSEIFLLPSYSENFGIAVVEAMMQGLPVIVSNRVNIWREIQQAGAGIVVNCRSDEVERAIWRLLEDRQVGIRMGACGVQLVKKQFTWDFAGRRLVEMYRRVLSGGSSETIAAHGAAGYRARL